MADKDVEIGLDGKPVDPSKYDNQKVVREKETKEKEVFY